MLQIKYKRTLQVEEFEPITIEVCRNYDDTTDEGFPGDAKEVFQKGIEELETLVDNELVAHVEKLKQEAFDAIPDVGV